jgi:hypothetical protein
MRSGGVSIGKTQKQYRCRSSTYEANRHRYVFLLINGSLVRARAGEPLLSSFPCHFKCLRGFPTREPLTYSLWVPGIRPRSAVSRSIGRRFEPSRTAALPPSNQSVTPFFGDGPVDHWSIGLWGVALGAARNGGGGGGEESSKKRTLRFLHWGSVVPKRSFKVTGF